MKKLNFEYDEQSDVITIEGQKYAGNFFRAMDPLGLACGELFCILKRRDGVHSIRRLKEVEWKPKKWWEVWR